MFVMYNIIYMFVNILHNYLRFQKVEHFKSYALVSKNEILKQGRGCFITVMSNNAFLFSSERL